MDIKFILSIVMVILLFAILFISLGIGFKLRQLEKLINLAKSRKEILLTDDEMKQIDKLFNKF